MSKLKEADHGRLFAEWLRQRELLFVHIPNEGVRSVMLATDMIRQGMQPGAPDYLVFSPPKRYLLSGGGRWFYQGVAIELKRPGWKPRNAKDKARLVLQENFLAELEEVGWATKICYGWEDAVAFMKELGYR